MTVVRYILKTLQLTCVVSLFIAFSSTQVLAGVPESLAEGDQARMMGDYPAAEKAYTEALAKEPGNYRILRSLVEVKFFQKKYKEAKPLAEKVLALEVTLQKKVNVFMPGESEPLEAELVDETVVAPDSGKNNMKNYLDPKAKGQIPHYRLFFLKSGKMKLIPKSQVRIVPIGVPRLDHERVKEIYAKIQVKLIDAAGSAKAVEMLPVEGGCFKMGSDKGAHNERPAHEVCVSSFKMDKYEVTQKSFQAVIGTNPSRFVAADLPVESVTWQEATKYCKKEGKRLPTEAEWEFAARGGAATEYYWGDAFDPSKGNFCDASCFVNVKNSGASDGYQYTAPVGKFPPNPFGLHDMNGNVAEWVNDWHQTNYYNNSKKDNPKGPRPDAEVTIGATNDKILRGGSWKSGPDTLRSAWRKSFWTDYRKDGLGFRCVADK
ncbi:MAG: SUMF1/EgtB/PvdO family nonheme iron enzyme [Nitrospinaceae bacterium]|nr:SUMF1/EgtB/PvdO family nonheme iron enzyme [Nitrospinaceae bacterium]